MSKLILLFLTIILMMLFLALPYSAELKDYFPLADMKLALQTHVYFICERIVLIIFAWIIYNESTRFKGALLVFFLLKIAVLIDYLLCYNIVWERIWGVPVSMSTFSILIFGLAICYQWIWRKE